MKTTTGLLCVAALALAACGDKPQTLSHKKNDTRAYEGTQQPAYTVPGWKAGDETSWETQMRTRAQQGQNEYTRATSR